MSLPTMETQFKVASEAAQNFVDHFYEARTRRRPLGMFYASTSARLTGASVKPDISVNGLPVADVAAYEAMLEGQGGPVVYDISSFDAHPVTAHYKTGEPETTGAGGAEGRDATAAAVLRNGDRMSFAIQVSGMIRYTHEHTAPATITAEAAKGTPPPPGEAPSANTNTAFAVGTTPTPAAEAELPEQPFNEAFLLVPHWEAWARNAPRNLRKWVIVSQNYRTL
ncbi:uncharacterized protein F4807DRAFT_404073 [Annulohypoxylon truncatum]|uniref:uncharacterized protein n=1 Tax=Annulohypoxylon truncatum TaxID=327061 RepID=UPI002008C9DA|nr:uncharacterized protein F4807DRAFT_404073 [Annulohypoxylon truncatum]KAI1214644.1 hypothetical protein F4807DRAFT_404073 [Annulohypoxylon truncatum]